MFFKGLTFKSVLSVYALMVFKAFPKLFTTLYNYNLLIVSLSSKTNAKVQIKTEWFKIDS
jgi:hypothetical protein